MISCRKCFASRSLTTTLGLESELDGIKLFVITSSHVRLAPRLLLNVVVHVFLIRDDMKLDLDKSESKNNSITSSPPHTFINPIRNPVIQHIKLPCIRQLDRLSRDIGLVVHVVEIDEGACGPCGAPHEVLKETFAFTHSWGSHVYDGSSGVHGRVARQETVAVYLGMWVAGCRG